MVTSARAAVMVAAYYCRQKALPMKCWTLARRKRRSSTSSKSSLVHYWLRTNNTYIGLYAPWEERSSPPWEARNVVSNDFAMERLARMLIFSITLKGISFLQSKGCQVTFWPYIRQLQLKLCAVEAGLGVYGRSGIILHPVLGNRLRLGAILTDATLEPDGRLEGYAPCENCDRCIQLCPGKIYEPTKSYPRSWSRKKAFRFWLIPRRL